MDNNNYIGSSCVRPTRDSLLFWALTELNLIADYQLYYTHFHYNREEVLIALLAKKPAKKTAPAAKKTVTKAAKKSVEEPKLSEAS